MARDLRLRLNREELRRLYLIEKRSLEDIARLYGVSRVAVWKYCKAERLTRRSRSEARLGAQKKGKVPQGYFDINEDFFSKWSPEMAYVLGLIITDGCVAKTGNISLNMNEKELLEKVKRIMGSQHKIIPSNHQEGLYCFHFSRVRLVEDLAGLGILPRKSLSVKFPTVPDAFMKDFIRGVFDGDGSVYFEKRSMRYPVRTSFVSSSLEFIEKLEVTLQQLGLPKRAIYKQKTKNGMHYKVRYSHENSKKLFKVMYYDIKNGLFMERKYKKFLDGFQQERSCV
ncbi:MAG: hypothetical protein A3K16_00795 [Omnitrophica bacterium RIFCSPLOWO2_01_FULL_45_24]|nr:MAG: hypothetical protein A3K16_00795 [Omnitrophica bacterium RIFCSPLOWO2_01_FULL_45_24]